MNVSPELPERTLHIMRIGTGWGRGKIAQMAKRTFPLLPGSILRRRNDVSGGHPYAHPAQGKENIWIAQLALPGPLSRAWAVAIFWRPAVSIYPISGDMRDTPY